MKKKLALSIISFDECFPQGGFSGGGHKVTKKLIEELIKSDEFSIDIFCQKGDFQKKYELDGINSIKVLNKKTFKEDFLNILEQSDYDYVLSSDVLLPYANNIIHSNSSAYKSKNGKCFLMKTVAKIFNAKKIKRQNKNISREKAVFTVSQRLKNDFVENFKLDEKKVHTAYPAVDSHCEFVEPVKKETFTVGSIVGGGLNKGGYLLLLALRNLKSEKNIKAKVIFPKIKKAFFFKTAVTILGLKDKIEILPRQKDMETYYKSIDCYVLPSLNEAFGLVVTEAASNSKPSIVSSTTGVRELIKDSVNGFVFEREKKPVKKLTEKIKEVTNLYFKDFEQFKEVSKDAHKTAQELSWQEFSRIITTNMIEEQKID